MKVIFWDFDGTLAYREGRFAKILFRVLSEQEINHNYKLDDIRPFLQTGFPWHNPEQPHLDLNDPEKWWFFVEDIFIRAYEGIGIDRAKAVKFAKLAHLKYIDPAGFLLYEDTEKTLDYFSRSGWDNVILSNHVPELNQIVCELGLNKYLSGCISSANIGYEKPNPEIYRIALKQFGNPKTAWMIGDNVIADVKGAEAVGINSILVRTKTEEQVNHYSDSLNKVIEIIDKC